MIDRDKIETRKKNLVKVKKMIVTYWDYCVQSGLCPECLFEAIEASRTLTYFDDEDEMNAHIKTLKIAEGTIPFAHKGSWVYLCETHAADDVEVPDRVLLQ